MLYWNSLSCLCIWCSITTLFPRGFGNYSLATCTYTYTPRVLLISMTILFFLDYVMTKTPLLERLLWTGLDACQLTSAAGYREVNGQQLRGATRQGFSVTNDIFTKTFPIYCHACCVCSKFQLIIEEYWFMKCAIVHQTAIWTNDDGVSFHIQSSITHLTAACLGWLNTYFQQSVKNTN